MKYWTVLVSEPHEEFKNSESESTSKFIDQPPPTTIVESFDRKNVEDSKVRSTDLVHVLFRIVAQKIVGSIV